jgi:two-component system, sensor histidine kinase and response regulator
MYHLRSFNLGDMTACGAALRVLGTGATNLEDAADRLVRFLYNSFTLDRSEESACVLVRLFKTTPYGRLPPELRDLVVTKLGKIPDDPFLPCLTLLASASAIQGWDDPSGSSHYRVVPLGDPGDLAQLPMFSQLFHQLGVSLPHLTQRDHHLLLDSEEHLFNVFHVLHAEGSPYIPAQDEFVVPYGVRSVVGFGAPLPNGDIFFSYSLQQAGHSRSDGTAVQTACPLRANHPRAACGHDSLSASVGHPATDRHRNRFARCQGCATERENR